MLNAFKVNRILDSLLKLFIVIGVTLFLVTGATVFAFPKSDIVQLNSQQLITKVIYLLVFVLIYRFHFFTSYENFFPLIIMHFLITAFYLASFFFTTSHNLNLLKFSYSLIFNGNTTLRKK